MRYTAPQWRPSLAKRRTSLRSAIDVSAFASVMFALLFLMMIQIPSFHYHQVPADLLRTHNAPFKTDALRDDAVILTITRDGSLYFRNTRMSADDLPDSLRETLRDGSEQTVYINADSRARYADVKPIVDRIRQAGVTNITFLTEWSRP